MNCSNAAPPKFVKWDGKAPPVPTATQRYIMWQDQQAGLWYATLADFGSCEVLLAVTTQIPDTETSQALIFMLATGGQLDISNRPPLPQPKGNFGPVVTSVAGNNAANYVSGGWGGNF